MEAEWCDRTQRGPPAAFCFLSEIPSFLADPLCLAAAAAPALADAPGSQAFSSVPINHQHGCCFGPHHDACAGTKLVMGPRRDRVPDGRQRYEAETSNKPQYWTCTRKETGDDEQLQRLIPAALQCSGRSTTGTPFIRPSLLRTQYTIYRAISFCLF